MDADFIVNDEEGSDCSEAAELGSYLPNCVHERPKFDETLPSVRKKTLGYTNNTRYLGDTWSSETEIGLSNTVQVTISSQAGVVSEPEYR